MIVARNNLSIFAGVIPALARNVLPSFVGPNGQPKFIQRQSACRQKLWPSADSLPAMRAKEGLFQSIIQPFFVSAFLGSTTYFRRQHVQGQSIFVIKFIDGIP